MLAPLIAAWLVGAVLVVAGAMKLARPSWLVDAARLGVPAPLARPVPYVEVVVGALVAVGVARPVTAAAAAALFVAFSVVIVARLRRGERPVCACFGSFSRRPIGAGSVARNLVLAACAAVATRA